MIIVFCFGILDFFLRYHIIGRFHITSMMIMQSILPFSLFYCSVSSWLEPFSYSKEEAFSYFRTRFWKSHKESVSQTISRPDSISVTEVPAKSNMVRFLRMTLNDACIFGHSCPATIFFHRWRRLHFAPHLSTRHSSQTTSIELVQP